MFIELINESLFNHRFGMEIADGFSAEASFLHEIIKLTLFTKGRQMNHYLSSLYDRRYQHQTYLIRRLKQLVLKFPGSLSKFSFKYCTMKPQNSIFLFHLFCKENCIGLRVT